MRLNGERSKPAKEVGPGDIVEVRLGESRRTVVIQEVAATLYQETDESIAERERAAAERKLSHLPGADLGGRRPTKQDRRRIEALRRRGQGA